ncbi:2Fe-2S ferredoxin-like protein [Psychrosphaera sp. F3M07]|jgi:ferredoxin|uniref:Class I ribonucleotide reductase maintenance protein YfaE n=1 Tax=Psychrosphaera aquimarina TaxID=2044854 RepID=A0ABU3QW40_9GAMM|nr:MULTISPECIES: class I ribonucleotide reductase maintenance protein YfaE [Psychrosphaera]MBU2918652.1 2Fe-2S ferredoxin-like protein [Psychrosphaera sp. F3M07]MDU0111645.1 class I ribonucleotide reductase maintenance protein YfaE [Psychrosphaera aquimarina]
MTKVTVHRHDVIETEIEFNNTDSTLLNSLQNNGVEVLYHCKEGFCGACRCKLKSGSITYINEPLAFVRKGEILTCCSVPNEDIEIQLL